MRRFAVGFFLLTCVACLACSRGKPDSSAAPPPARTTAEKPRPGVLLTGDAAKGDWTTDAPGVRRKLTAADLPRPGATDSVDNGPRVIDRPAGALPRVPEGFEVKLFAEGLSYPRMVRVAPNGDVFVVESRANRVVVLRDGKKSVFAVGLNEPFGLAFLPGFVYVANTDSVVRFAYQDGDVEARAQPEKIVSTLSGGGRLRGGGHWTRDIVFSKDGSKMFVSVGSRSNVSDDEGEARRARIFEYTPDGKNERVFATGIRNPVGLAVHPDTGELWTSVNERDELGDHLVPDYVTRVRDGGFYGWPWFYIGPNQDPRHEGKHPELKDKVIVPDVLVQSHSASLGMTFYAGTQFPAEWRGAFAAEHGSWNRARRTGYKVIFVPVKDGVPTGEYVDFMTGFVAGEREVWGRPSSVAVAKDGSLLVTDDDGNCIWRVSYSAASR